MTAKRQSNYTGDCHSPTAYGALFFVPLLREPQYNPDGLAALFTEDAVWESQGFGRFEGRDAIRAFFRGASQLFTFAIQYSLNGQIDVQGDTARAQWYLFMPCTLGEGSRAMWRAGVDHEEYIRVAGKWKFKRKISAPLFHTPL